MLFHWMCHSMALAIVFLLIFNAKNTLLHKLSATWLLALGM
jgi:hypothetical protein